MLRSEPFAPLPQKSDVRHIAPGDSRSAKLGPVARPVNTPLWTTLWITWGHSGMSLWTSREYGCEVSH